MKGNNQINEDKIKPVETLIEKSDAVTELIGFGKFEFKNKIVYIGSYKQTPSGKFRHGKGKIYHPISEKIKIGQETYDGDWVNDKMEGYGLYNYPNGDLYEGEFYNNLHQGFGKYYFVDGSRYEGDWYEHKMHGSGSYWDISGNLWTGEFRNGEYISKEQARLKEEKRIEKKTEKIKDYVKLFLQSWETKYSSSNKKNIKENLKTFFTNEKQMSNYILGPYPALEDKSHLEWNTLFKLLLENSANLKINVPKSNHSLIFFDKSRLKCNQLQDELSSGQLIEILFSTQDNIDTYKLAIGYIREFEMWFLVYFKHEKIEIKETQTVVNEVPVEKNSKTKKK